MFSQVWPANLSAFGTDVNTVHSTHFVLIFHKRYCSTFMVFDIKFLKFVTFSITYLTIGRLFIYSIERYFLDTH